MEMDKRYVIHSGYCCLNSKTGPGLRHLRTLINATAGCAVVSTETLTGQRVTSPKRGVVRPDGTALLTSHTHETGALQ